MKLKCWHIYTPLDYGLHVRLCPTLMATATSDQRPRLAKARQVPRAPLLATGVTSRGVMSLITSEGVTPPSSLILTHAPDQIPLTDFGFPLYSGSLQVVTSPCWEMVLPGVISAILVWVLGPLPRSASSVLLSVSSRRATASPHEAQVRRARQSS